MEAKSSVESHILLDVSEDSFERIGGVWNVEVRVPEVDEEMRQISLHAVVGASKSAMGVVPSPYDLIRCALLEKRSPFVVPEFQP